jgi:hypothetical protein
LLVLTAYLDASGQQSQDYVFIAGFLGNEQQWKQCARDWRAGLGQRKALHMNELRWANGRTKKLLAKLGPIPMSAGLEPMVGGVKVSDYSDLISGGVEEVLLNGYVTALYPLLIQCLRLIPKNERLELVFEQQDRYAPFANAMLGAISRMRIPEVLLTDEGLPKLASWRWVPKESTMLLQPADYLAYTTTQVYRDSHSERAQMCMPIIGGESTMIIGKVLSRHEVRSTIQVSQALVQAERQTMMDLKPKTEEQMKLFTKMVTDAVRGEN